MNKWLKINLKDFAKKVGIFLIWILVILVTLLVLTVIIFVGSKAANCVFGASLADGQSQMECIMSEPFRNILYTIAGVVVAIVLVKFVEWCYKKGA